MMIDGTMAKPACCVSLYQNCRGLLNVIFWVNYSFTVVPKTLSNLKQCNSLGIFD